MLVREIGLKMWLIFLKYYLLLRYQGKFVPWSFRHREGQAHHPAALVLQVSLPICLFADINNSLVRGRICMLHNSGKIKLINKQQTHSHLHRFLGVKSTWFSEDWQSFIHSNIQTSNVYSSSCMCLAHPFKLSSNDPSCFSPLNLNSNRECEKGKIQDGSIGKTHADFGYGKITEQGRNCIPWEHLQSFQWKAWKT